MNGEESELSVRLPPDLATWLADLADDDAPETVARDLLAAYRSVEEDRDEAVDPSETSDRLDDQREEYRDLIEDVRERVIQVKRETDGKAPADHSHPELVETLSEIEADLSTVEDDLQSGFENYEEVLEYLTETTDDLGSDVDVLAQALVRLRERTGELAGLAERRERTDQLRLAANQLGIRKADCEECESTVDVALLTEPECPHCRAEFEDVEAGSGFFSSNELLTGDAPALEGAVGVDDDALTGVLDDDRDPPSTNLSDSGGDPT